MTFLLLMLIPLTIVLRSVGFKILSFVGIVCTSTVHLLLRFSLFLDFSPHLPIPDLLRKGEPLPFPSIHQGF